jgi:hypothetical protein
VGGVARCGSVGWDCSFCLAVGFIGRCYNLVCGSLGPSNTVLPPRVTLHTFWVKVTSHPWSQNCLVVGNDVCVNFGTMWPAVIMCGIAMECRGYRCVMIVFCCHPVT